jgi:hypothetical protein
METWSRADNEAYNGIDDANSKARALSSDCPQVVSESGVASVIVMRSAGKKFGKKFGDE